MEERASAPPCLGGLTADTRNHRRRTNCNRRCCRNPSWSFRRTQAAPQRTTASSSRFDLQEGDLVKTSARGCGSSRSSSPCRECPTIPQTGLVQPDFSRRSRPDSTNVQGSRVLRRTSRSPSPPPSSSRPLAVHRHARGISCSLALRRSEVWGLPRG